MPADRALFHKFKTRPEGTNAGFILEDGGELTVLDPTEMRTMNAQKLRARMKRKGVAGTFYKGSKGPVFCIQAGKQGGNASQPWVKQRLRQDLGVSMLEVITASDADLEAEEAAAEDGVAPGAAGAGLPDLDALDLLGADPLTEGIEDLPEDLGGLLDALEEGDAAGSAARLAAVEALLEELSDAAGRLEALGAPTAGAFRAAHETWAARLLDLDGASDPAEAARDLEAFRVGVQGALDKAAAACDARADRLRGAAAAALDALKADPRSAWVGSGLAALEAQLGAAEDHLPADPARAARIWSELPASCAGAIEASPAYAAYRETRARVTAELYLLEDLLHKERVRLHISSGEGALSRAHLLAEQGKVAQANGALEQARIWAEDGAEVGAAYEQYRTARAPVFEAMRVYGAKSVLDDIKEADGHADDPLAPDFDEANRLLASARRVADNLMTRLAGALPEEQIAACRAAPGADFIAPVIAQMEALLAESKAALAAGEYLQVELNASRIRELAQAATARAARRQVFEAQRATTVAALERAEANPHLQAPCAELRAALDGADALASVEVLRIEEGTEALARVEAQALRLPALGAQAQELWERLQAIEARLVALQARPGVALVQELLDGSAALLPLALRSVGMDPSAARMAPAAPLGPEPYDLDFDGALDALGQAEAHLDVAEERLDGAAPMLALRDGATQAEDAEDLRIILDAVRARAEALDLHPHHARVEEDADAVRAACAEVLEALGAPGGGGPADPAAVRGTLTAAADRLLVAETTHAAHAAHAADHAVQLQQLRLLEGSVYADAVQPKLVAIAAQLEVADRCAAEGDYAGAARALGGASVANAEAADLLDARRRYEERRGQAPPAATGLWARVEEVFDPDLDQAARAHLAAADAAADGLRFPEAETGLDHAESQCTLDAMRENPILTDPELVAQGEALLEMEGGEAALDAFIAQLPDGPFAFELMQALAEARFGVQWESEGGREFESMRRIWAVMATCPDEAVEDNPSLRVVKRGDPTSSGGAYSPRTKQVVIDGRPGSSDTKRFGSQNQNARGEGKLAEVEPDCQPVDERAVDFFDWSTLHEVGHAVDDRLGFMNARQGDPAFGDWTFLDMDVGGLVDAVATTLGGPDAEPLRPYVRAVVGEGDPTMIPEPEELSGDWDALRAAVDQWYTLATKGEPWWSESDSQKLKLHDGYIYQRAYPRKWVRYAASARKKGLTGYQFRAPGEWFAELYAGYHSGKLKPAHPSSAWLGTL